MSQTPQAVGWHKLYVWAVRQVLPAQAETKARAVPARSSFGSQPLSALHLALVLSRPGSNLLAERTAGEARESLLRRAAALQAEGAAAARELASLNRRMEVAEAAVLAPLQAAADERLVCVLQSHTVAHAWLVMAGTCVLMVGPMLVTMNPIWQ